MYPMHCRDVWPVYQFSYSGNPTEDNTIRVRGINSITAETGPLVVIDGFIGGYFSR